MEIEVLYRDRPFIVSGAKNRWAGRRKVELAELVDEPWLLAHESIFSSLVEEAFQSQRLARPKLGVRTYSTYQRLSLLATNSFIGGESGSVLRFNMTDSRSSIARRFSFSFLANCNRHAQGSNPQFGRANLYRCAREVAADDAGGCSARYRTHPVTVILEM